MSAPNENDNSVGSRSSRKRRPSPAGGATPARSSRQRTGRSSSPASAFSPIDFPTRPLSARELYLTGPPDRWHLLSPEIQHEKIATLALAAASDRQQAKKEKERKKKERERAKQQREEELASAPDGYSELFPDESWSLLSMDVRDRREKVCRKASVQDKTTSAGTWHGNAFDKAAKKTAKESQPHTRDRRMEVMSMFKKLLKHNDEFKKCKGGTKIMAIMTTDIDVPGDNNKGGVKTLEQELVFLIGGGINDFKNMVTKVKTESIERKKKKLRGDREFNCKEVRDMLDVDNMFVEASSRARFKQLPNEKIANL